MTLSLSSVRAVRFASARFVFPGLALASLLAVMPAPSAAGDLYRAQNGLDITATGAGAFAVQRSGGAGPRETWCAASEYAARRLGVRGAARLYLAEGAGARGPVHFTLTAPADGGTRLGQGGNYSVRLDLAGFHMSQIHAEALCRLREDDPPWIL